MGGLSARPRLIAAAAVALATLGATVGVLTTDAGAPPADGAPAMAAAPPGQRRQLQGGFGGGQMSPQQLVMKQMQQMQRFKQMGGGGGNGMPMASWKNQALMSARWQQAARARLQGGGGGGGGAAPWPGLSQPTVPGPAPLQQGKFARTSKHGGNRSSSASLVQRRKPFAGINASQVVAIMCMGDSWMTGLNAAQFGHLWDLSKVIIDYRGGAWACGSGDIGLGLPKMETFGTLMLRYNRKLLGPASGHTNRFDPCVQRQSECGLNAASDGASLPDTSPNQGVEKLERPNVLYSQAEDLSKWLHGPYSATLPKWKVLTLLASWGDQWWTPRDIQLLHTELWRVMSYLKAHMPYTYVNLLALSDEPHTLEEVQSESMWCRTQVTAWKQKVAMASGTKFNDMNGADEFAAQLNAMLLEAAETFDDPAAHFVVRFQPLLRGFRFQRRVGDPFTCFHPSRELTKELAFGLLQNMAAPSTRDAVADLNFYHEGRPGDSAVMKQFKAYVRSGQDLILL